MTDPLQHALTVLNEAAYAALRAGKDRITYPNLNRQALRRIARQTDALVESGGEDADEVLE